jgi:hypothetical protein
MFWVKTGCAARDMNILVFIRYGSPSHLYICGLARVLYGKGQDKKRDWLLRMWFVSFRILAGKATVPTEVSTYG